MLNSPVYYEGLDLIREAADDPEAFTDEVKQVTGSLRAEEPYFRINDGKTGITAYDPQPESVGIVVNGPSKMLNGYVFARREDSPCEMDSFDFLSFRYNPRKDEMRALNYGENRALRRSGLPQSPERRTEFYADLLKSIGADPYPVRAHLEPTPTR